MNRLSSFFNSKPDEILTKCAARGMQALLGILATDRLGAIGRDGIDSRRLNTATLVCDSGA